MIPYFELKSQLVSMGREVRAAIDDVLGKPAFRMRAGGGERLHSRGFRHAIWVVHFRCSTQRESAS